MRALVLTTKDPSEAYEGGRVVEELKKKQIETDWFYYEDWTFEVFPDAPPVFKYLDLEVDVGNYHFAYIRSSLRDSLSFTDLKTILITECLSLGVLVPNGKSLVRWVHFPKSLQHYLLSSHAIPTVHTFYTSTFQSEKLPFTLPFILKRSSGSMGKHVHKVVSMKQVQTLTDLYGASQVIQQPFLERGKDYRVFVVDGEILGVMERRVAAGSHLSNISAGGHAVKSVTTPEISRLVKKVTRLFKLAICGIDVIFSDDGAPLVLEVNRHPQFQGFEKVMGINVAQAIVERLVR